MTRGATLVPGPGRATAGAAPATGGVRSPVQAYDGLVAKLLLWAVGSLLLGVVLGVLGGLLRRRPVPEVTSYVAPPVAEGRTAVGPHREVLRAAPV